MSGPTATPATRPAGRPLAARPLSGRHVAVVGGGLAGLAAALEASDLGARVTLLERRRRLGGLTWSFRHSGPGADGMWVDNGQHVYLACCDAYRRFLDRIGATDDVVAPRPLDVPVLAPGPTPGSMPVAGRLRRRSLPVPLHLAPALMAYPHISTGDRLRLGRALLGLARLDLDDPALDRQTFGSWLSAHGQSPTAIEAVWDLITIPTVNLPAREASLATAAMVFKTGLLSAPGAADIGWSRVPLGRLHGERAERALARAGVTVRSEVRVGAVRPAGGGWEVLTAGGPLEADAVVVALPHEEAVSVVPADSVPGQGRWEELGSSAIVDVHLVFDRPVTGEELLAGHRSPIQWVFDRTASAGLADGASGRTGGRQYLAVSLSAADHLLGERPESLIERTVGELGRLLPAVAGARLVDSLVTKERRATFRAAPGSASLRPGPRTGHPGLALAGAWTATGWPATMEGAVRSGVAAAGVLAATGAAPGPPPGHESHTDIPQSAQEVA